MRNKADKTLAKKFASFVENQTDMPPVSISDLPYIEISGQKHIEIDGIQKILEYKENIIKIRFHHSTVCFNGENLFLRDYNQKNAIIEGKICSVEFE